MVDGGRGLQAGMQVLVLPGRDSLQWYTHTHTLTLTHTHMHLCSIASLSICPGASSCLPHLHSPEMSALVTTGRLPCSLLNA